MARVGEGCNSAIICLGGGICPPAPPPLNYTLHTVDVFSCFYFPLPSFSLLLTLFSPPPSSPSSLLSFKHSPLEDNVLEQEESEEEEDEDDEEEGEGDEGDNSEEEHLEEDEGEMTYNLRKRRPVIYQYQPVIQASLNDDHIHKYNQHACVSVQT